LEIEMPTPHRPPTSWTSPSWATSSYGEPADTSPTELSALGDHLSLCAGLKGRMFATRCFCEVMHGFVASRFVTTLAVATLVIGAIALLN
jgi:hypothetical protein